MAEQRATLLTESGGRQVEPELPGVADAAAIAPRRFTTGLAGELHDLPVRIGPSPWPGYEHVRGYGVYAAPFSSGHVLCLRVFPENDFAPYVTVWHRTPAGDWTIFYDAPRADIACPRYYGAAARQVRPARIRPTWTGPMTLHVAMDAPALDWTLTMAAPAPLAALNASSARLPIAAWRSPALRSVMRWMARRFLGLGEITLAGTMPSGHDGILMPARVYFVTESRAVLDGLDLGQPARVAENPAIGAVRLPARPVLAVGQGFWRIKDEEEYRRTCAALRGQGLGAGDERQGRGGGAATRE